MAFFSGLATALIGHLPNFVRYGLFSIYHPPPTTNTSILYSNNLYIMATQRATLVTWMKEELERLVAWMEENPEDLRGKQALA